MQRMRHIDSTSKDYYVWELRLNNYNISQHSIVACKKDD